MYLRLDTLDGMHGYKLISLLSVGSVWILRAPLDFESRFASICQLVTGSTVYGLRPTSGFVRACLNLTSISISIN